MDTISIRNWQSLKRVDLDLGRFTVIVGPSSSGKTALIRALRALTSNVRGSDFVSRGQRAAAVSARVGDSGVVLLRGEGVGKYQVKFWNEQEGVFAEEVFTKLNGGVPDLVTTTLGVPPNSAIHFAGQFDPPYLLTSSGAEVARVLGELTNVSTILEAVREANRRRAASNSQLKTRKADLDRLKTGLKDYTDVPRKLAVLEQAESQMVRVEAAEQSLSRLRSLLTDQEVAQGILTREAAKAPPSYEAVSEAYDRLYRLKELLGAANRTREQIQDLDAKLKEQSDYIEALHLRLHDLLVEAGVCPTCQQPIQKVKTPTA